MVKRLTRLKVSEISSVDRGAGEGVRVVLMKRDGSDMEKRTFTAEERRRDAKSGAAMQGGRYPIENVQDLHNAIRAIGRGKGSHEAIRRHIIARARALGATSALPESWKVKKGVTETLKSWLGFQEPTLADVMSDAQEALLKSVTDVIATDADRVTKTEAVRKLFADYEEHMAGAVPEAVEKALADAGFDSADLNTNPGDVRKESDMADDRREDEREEREEKAREEHKEEKARDHKEPDGDEGGAREVEERKAREEREEKARHEEDERKAREEREEKAGMKGGSDIDKRYATEIAKRDAEIADIRKQMAALLAQSTAVEFAKRATDMGMPAAFGETIRKAESGDKAAVHDILKRLESAMRAEGASVVFKEFGANGNGVSDDPIDQITAKAEELRKNQPNLSKEQAFAKAYEANPELARAERRANRPAA